MRTIHIQSQGMGEYLIGLIQKQQELSEGLQMFMPEYWRALLQGILFLSCVDKYIEYAKSAESTQIQRAIYDICHQSISNRKKACFE